MSVADDTARPAFCTTDYHHSPLLVLLRSQLQRIVVFLNLSMGDSHPLTPAFATPLPLGAPTTDTDLSHSPLLVLSLKPIW